MTSEKVCFAAGTHIIEFLTTAPTTSIWALSMLNISTFQGIGLASIVLGSGSVVGIFSAATRRVNTSIETQNTQWIRFGTMIRPKPAAYHWVHPPHVSYLGIVTGDFCGWHEPRDNNLCALLKKNARKGVSRLPCWWIYAKMAEHRARCGRLMMCLCPISRIHYLYLLAVIPALSRLRGWRAHLLYDWVESPHILEIFRAQMPQLSRPYDHCTTGWAFPRLLRSVCAHDNIVNSLKLR